MTLNTSDNYKKLLYSLADAIETDLTITSDDHLVGSRTGVLDLFEGYSPVVVSGIKSSLYDTFNLVSAVDQQIFGNVYAVTVVELSKNSAHTFIYDASKTPENSNCTPWEQNRWSRKRLYYWLEDSVTAIYHRKLHVCDWRKLHNGKKKLSQYNKARDHGFRAKEAYADLWGSEYFDNATG
jgi:hypothetical protein